MTYGDRTIAVVIPAYNEAGFIGDVVETVPAFVDRVYVVDDKSTDPTWEEMTEAAERMNRRMCGPDGGDWVVTIHHDTNQGVGGAIKTGYDRALADGMEVLAVMNGDGQMDPNQLHRLIHPVAVGDAGYAKGDRLSHPGYREGMSAWRSFGNHLLTTLTRVGSGYWAMHDPQNGYTAASREALEAIDYESTYDRYGFCNDLLVRFNVRGIRLVDVPMPAVYGDETSHIRYSQFAPGLSLLLLKSFLRRVAIGLVSPEEDRGRLSAALYLGGMLLSAVSVVAALFRRDRTRVTLPTGLALVAGGMTADARSNEKLYHRAPPTDAAAAPDAPDGADRHTVDDERHERADVEAVDVPASADGTGDAGGAGSADGASGSGVTTDMDTDETTGQDGGTERTNGHKRHERTDEAATDGGAGDGEADG